MSLEDWKEKNQVVPPIFEGLSEKDLVPVYTLGKINKLKTGEVFIREGDADRTVYVILEGSVSIFKEINGLRQEIAALSSSNCVGEIAFAKDARRTASAVASEPTVVMALDEQGLNALPGAVKSVILRNLNSLANARIDELTEKASVLSRRNTYLIDYVKERLHGNSLLYHHSEMIQQILKSFPKLPLYVVELTQMLSDENVSADGLIECARTDPSLVAQVLKTANSPYYNFPGKVADFQHAVLLLGFNQIYQIVMDNGIKNVMPRRSEFMQLQFYSLLASLVGYELAQTRAMKRPLMMSTLGLLHKMGRSIVLLLKQDFANMAVLLELLDDATIGALLLREWNLPEQVCRVIEYHRHPEFSPPEELPPDCRELASVLHISRLCCDYMTGTDKDRLRDGFLREYMLLLDLPYDEEGPIQGLLNNTIFPSLKKKLDILPEIVRSFLQKKGISPNGA